MKLAACAVGALAFIVVRSWRIGGVPTAGPVAGCVCSDGDCAAAAWVVATCVAAVAAPPAGATAPNAAGVSWWAAHDAKCSGDTVNTLNRMFACDAPQYSAHMPFSAC